MTYYKSGIRKGWPSHKDFSERYTPTAHFGVFRKLDAARVAYLTVVSIILFAIAQSIPSVTVLSTNVFFRSSAVSWKSCGGGFEGYQCANISLPLDWHNATDPRRVTIAVTRYMATDITHRKGAVFINPGGPGGSGTSFAFTRGVELSNVLKDQDVFAVLVNDFDLNLPVNITTRVVADLEAQVLKAAAAMSAVSAKCSERVGDPMAYFGTEAVVRDIDAMSRLIEGEDARINFWGFSYGTIIGQYLVKILQPERIGRVMIDGIANPDVWAGNPRRSFEHHFTDIDKVLFSFAKSCSAAGDACALSSLQASEILSKIDQIIDSLYHNPVPITDLPIPTVASAATFRRLVFTSMNNTKTWPALAEHLQNAFKGNFTGVASTTMPKVDHSGASRTDSSAYAGKVIRCIDAKPYSSSEEPPTSAELAEYVLESLRTYSYRMGDRHFPGTFCHIWQGASGKTT